MPLFPTLKAYIKNDEIAALAVVVRGPAEMVGCKALIPARGEAEGPLLDTPWGPQVLEDAPGLMRAGQAVVREYGDGLAVFFDVYRSAPKLIIVGAMHIGIDLIDYARPLGYRAYVVDPRTAFATDDRFAHADALIHRWPDKALPEIGLTPETAVVLITHDPKLDDPALQVALPSPAFYVGALGSPKTHAQRVERLLAAGMPQSQLDRLHAPIGLDLGGRSPAEIALSIIAEIVAIRNKKTITL